MALRAPAPVARDDFAELARLWSSGVTMGHDAGCACGGLAMPSIAAGDIERDFLSYLAGKYRATPELAAVVAARIERPEGGFESWLAGLGDADLSEASREKLAADLRVFLESLGARSRFSVCY